jgi:ribonuclease HI
VDLPSFDVLIFSDASFDARSGLGVGAILALSRSEWEKNRETLDFPIQVKTFSEKNIARLEWVTALWALQSSKETSSGEICLVTDCKAIVDLPRRRTKLEETDFRSKRTSKELANADLYRKFLTVYDKIQLKLVWIPGHSTSMNRDGVAKVFSRVDRAARRTLRLHLADRSINLK